MKYEAVLGGDTTLRHPYAEDVEASRRHARESRERQHKRLRERRRLRTEERANVTLPRLSWDKDEGAPAGE